MKPPDKRVRLDTIISSLRHNYQRATTLRVVQSKLEEDHRRIAIETEIFTPHGGETVYLKLTRRAVPDAEGDVGPLQSTHGDPRVTQVGRILRATALDELPQLWSILRGHMSFVGPRALRPGEIEVNGNGACVPIEAIPGYLERHMVPPGLTGLAQVYAPRDIPRHQKFRYDVLYIRSRSPWLDLRLIAASLWISARGRWENRERKF